LSIFNRFNDDPLGAVLWAVALLLSVTLHEYGHAWAAIWMGDDTPKVNGRFSWNPLRYLDPIGIGMFLLIGFGALGSVRTRPDLYRNRTLGEVVVSSAGIVMNLVLVGVSAVILRIFVDSSALDTINVLAPGDTGPQMLRIGFFGGVFVHAPGWMLAFSLELFRLNVVLAVFNAFPIPPLDGSRVLAAIVPGALGESLRAYLHAPSSSFLLLFAIVALNQPIGKLLSDAVRLAARLLL
jgi:Zn-dependent protease